MPGETSNNKTLKDTFTGYKRLNKHTRKFGCTNSLLIPLRKTIKSDHYILKLMATSSLISFNLPGAKAYAATDILLDFISRLGTPDVLMLAVFGGAMSFALMSASWMIRERARISDENSNLKKNLYKLRAISDRNEALVAITGQCTIVWNSVEDDPHIMGKLSRESHAPENTREFLAYETWLNEESAKELKVYTKLLRSNAKNFDIIIETRSGHVLEAQGRTSGAWAYIRFSELSGEREEFAQLKSKHEKIVSRFNVIETFFGKIPMPIWMQEKNGNLSWANAAYAKALDLSTVKEVIEKQVELFDSEQRNEIKTGSAPDSLFNEILPATVSGDRKKLEVYSIQTQAGNMGLALDQSATEEIRATLNETIEGHSKMLDQLATAVAIFDKSKKLVFHNSGFQQLWKIEPALLENGPSNSEVLDAIRDKNILPFNPDWKKWRDTQLEIYTAIEPVEEWWHLLDGQTLRVIVTPRNEGGATWVFENVTEKLALESNYNSLMRVQGETLDHLIEAVAVFGSNGNLKLFNPALKKLWQENELEAQEGIHIAKVIESWSQAISNEDDLSKILGKITGFDDTRDTFSGRLELRNGNTLQYSLVPLPEGQSMLTFSDVTASVNFERALQDRAEALEESDRLKNKFIQHVSYQLRAPLTSIAGFGEMLSSPDMGELNIKQDEYLNHINEAADTLRSIVDDILDLACVDAGTISLDLETLDLNKTISKAISSFDSVIEEKQVKFKTEIDKNSSTVIADSKRLMQILKNLISNALTFSPDGGVVYIKAINNAMMHEISIIDQGPGVTAENQKLIFDRFETSSPDGSRLGTGLGLSIVRSFVDLHGGEVGVENFENGGACFVFSIPVDPTGQMENEGQIA